MDMSNLTTPREIDMALAAKHHELDKANQQVAYSNGDMFTLAGAKYEYRGRKRVPNMTLEEAIEKANENLAALQAYMEANEYTEKGTYGEYTGVRWDDWNGTIPSYEARRALEAFPKRNERLAVVDRIRDEINELNRLYTGWSRFFLVTSSPGHVHSSMHCSSCRPTTTYGWLPELSGKDEATAVGELGPTLCSVCFTSAPTEHVGGKITAAKAAKLAA
jgi:hypothetical protein